MKAHLLYRDQEFDWHWALQAAALREEARGGRRSGVRKFDWNSGLPWNAEALTTDLGLNTVFNAMARGDDCVFDVSRKVMLAAVTSDPDTIRYRQEILQDCLDHPAIARELYSLAVDANAKRKGWYPLGSLSRFPDSVLRDAMETMETLLGSLQRLRSLADRYADRFVSEGWTRLFAMLKQDLDHEYFARVQGHLEELRFRHGELLSAELSKANKGGRYVLHRVPYRKWTLWTWWTGLFEEKPATYRFEIPPRDEAGAQALTELRNRGLALAANALGQAADHVRDFFSMLRAELAFYVGCLNLHERVVRKGEPTCMPVPAAADEHRLAFRGLYDVALTLTVDRRLVGNDAGADRKDLVVITGPNTGGKSTFLRSIGLAQLMMQSGMFVPAESFRAILCDGLVTHYKREEDVSMESGKLDEELSRMSEVIDHLAPQSMVLFNESFAATNEREGSEIGRQIISALLERRIRVLCVTHMYELARGFHERDMSNALFLRAERRADGSRTFKVIEGEPLPTSFGEDVYQSIFSTASGHRAPAGTR